MSKGAEINDKVVHAKLWNNAVHKILTSLDKEELHQANHIFTYEHQWLLEKMPMDERICIQFFLSWLIACYRKDNLLLIEWYFKNHSTKLTKEEKIVLTEFTGSRFDLFKVESHLDGELKLIDTGGKKFVVETVEMEPITKDKTLFTRINNKGNDRYFLPGPTFQYENDELYMELKQHRKFRDSWSNYLQKFFDHQVSEGLSERTADKHTENVTLLTMYLETKPNVDSFSKVTKQMLNTEFKKYMKKYIMPTPDPDKVYYSLYTFFDYLEWERKIKNEEVMKWLRNRL